MRVEGSSAIGAGDRQEERHQEGHHREEGRLLDQEHHRDLARLQK